MKAGIVILSVACACLGANSYGQGTLHITFDGPPPQPSGTGRTIQAYAEGGMSFTPLPGSVGFVRSGGGIEGFPENGTAYTLAGLGMTLMFSFTNGMSFDMT